MRTLVAILVCALLQVVLFGLLLLVISGQYVNLLYGLPRLSTEPSHGVAINFGRAVYFHLSEMQFPITHTLSLFVKIAGVVSLLTLASNVHTILVPSCTRFQPSDNPLGYAVFRVRRFLLLPIILGYGLLAARLLQVESFRPLTGSDLEMASTALAFLYIPEFFFVCRPPEVTPMMAVKAVWSVLSK